LDEQSLEVSGEEDIVAFLSNFKSRAIEMLTGENRKWRVVS
jgi:hypothetical protein